MHSNFVTQLLGARTDDEVVILYVAHSTVVVRHRRHVLVFDWASPGPFPVGSFLGLCPLEALEGFQVVLLTSHAHGDHFNPDAVLGLPARENFHWVLPPDVGRPARVGARSAHVARSGAWAAVGGLRVFASSASDAGVAYLVELPGCVVYHSGDNAYWNWDGAGQPALDFLPWLQAFVDRKMKVDVALQVGDPRLAAGGFGGIVDLPSFLDVGLLVPIHNFGDFSGRAAMRQAVARAHPGVRYWDVDRNGAVLVHRLE